MRCMAICALAACGLCGAANGQDVLEGIAPATDAPSLTVTPKPITLAWKRADGEDVRMLADAMRTTASLFAQDKPVESVLEMVLRAIATTQQQAQQIEALRAAIAERDERLKGIEARISALEK